ncbi:siphovirus Gp157 family protein [Propionivibrio sp.]|uniref:siphovirus Gp157 family protein n=1 Tax=Propionivibrio sp. TaxID=2212460 RepID=UPI003BF323F6
MNLYQLASEYKLAEEKLMDSNLPDEVIIDTLEGMSGDLSEKIINTAKVIQNMRAESKAIDDAIASMQLRAKATDKRADSLEDYLLANMQLADMPKVKSPWFVVSLKASQRTIIDDESLLPFNYLTEKPAVAAYTQPDKAAIKKAIAEGFPVPGAHIEKHMTVSIK